MEKQNSQFEHRQPMEQTRGLICTYDSGVVPCQSQLGNEFGVRSVLHGQVSLVAINQMCVINEAMNGCKNSKIHEMIASKM